MPNHPDPTYQLTYEDAVDIWLKVWSLDWTKQAIINHFNVNTFRIYEILDEEKFPGSRDEAAQRAKAQGIEVPERGTEVQHRGKRSLSNDSSDDPQGTFGF